MTMQPTFPCDSCNASNTPMSIMFRCGTCYYQNGKMPTKYVPTSHSANGSADSAETFGKPEHQFKYVAYGLRADENGKLSVGELPKREWVGLTEDEIKKVMQQWRNGYIDIKDVEQLLKDKNK